MSIETQVKERILVWTKTEKAGTIVTVDKTEGDFTYFTDGSKVFSNILNEDFFIDAKNTEDAERIAVPFRNITTGGLSTEAPTTNDTKVPVATSQDAVREGNKVVNDDSYVMLEMLKKISAKNTISMPLELNVPSKEVYELFKDQMDITKADLNDHILELVLSQIDNLQAQLKPQAEEFIKTYYNGKNTRRQSNTRTETGSRTGGNNAPDITF